MEKVTFQDEQKFPKPKDHSLLTKMGARLLGFGGERLVARCMCRLGHLCLSTEET